MTNQEDLNPKAREAFARSVIEIGVSIFKAVMVVIVVLPMTAVAKYIFQDPDSPVSLIRMFFSISALAWIVFGVLVVLGMIVGLYFRDKGVKILNEMENKES